MAQQEEDPIDGSILDDPNASDQPFHLSRVSPPGSSPMDRNPRSAPTTYVESIQLENGNNKNAALPKIGARLNGRERPKANTGQFVFKNSVQQERGRSNSNFQGMPGVDPVPKPAYQNTPQPKRRFPSSPLASPNSSATNVMDDPMDISDSPKSNGFQNGRSEYQNGNRNEDGNKRSEYQNGVHSQNQLRIEELDKDDEYAAVELDGPLTQKMIDDLAVELTADGTSERKKFQKFIK
jgi:hypothetical protein